MVLLKQTFLVEGLNQEILFSRLKKQHVNVLKIKILSKKQSEITIDKKDCRKFFAICKNIWYNKVLKTSGILWPFYAAYKAPLISLSLILSLILTFVLSNVYVGKIYKGDSIKFKAQIEKTFEECHISSYKFFDDAMLKKASETLSKSPSISFVQIEKWGNKAIIHIKEQIKPPDFIEKVKGDIVSDGDYTIKNIVVFSGTPLVKNGDKVKKGQILVGAYYKDDQNIVPCDIMAIITVECVYQFVYESKFEVNDELISDALSLAKFQLPNCEILKEEVIKLGKNKLKVKLTYQKTLQGGKTCKKSVKN